MNYNSWQKHFRCWGAILLSTLWIANLAMGQSPESEASQFEFFEKRIRPLLVDQCYSCHSASSEKIKGGLLLDSKESILRGGDTGPAMILGNAAGSLMIKAVHYKDPDLQMPPKNKKLSNRQIQDLELWINLGAAWPNSANGSVPSTNRVGFEISAKDLAYWAFQPVHRPELPILRQEERGTTPIDGFLRDKLEKQGIQPNKQASPFELMRRVYLDMIGLPPSITELQEFERDHSPRAYEQLVDRLLSRPEYGERWGRHWLDVVRYAQSNGYERDGEKPFAWRYRDYVIKAFNSDKPYDQFLREQIAGDELPEQTTDAIIATGFQRLGVWDDEPDDKRMAEFDELDDILSTTGTAMMGLTLGCARCHDHKFDPISHGDYYKLLSFFRNVRPYENARYALDSANYAPLATQKEIKTWRSQHESQINVFEAKIKGTSDEPTRKKLGEDLKQLQSQQPPFEWALAVRERGPTAPPTHILIRGNSASPSSEVFPAFPSIFGGKKLQETKSTNATSTTGRRLAFADWLVSRDNPMTARVMVNRIWQHHFGQGIVKTTTDFGKAGLPPTHPKLLDWLASEFMEKGWSVKAMHRSILYSQAYQRSSRNVNPEAEKLDPENDFLWRQNLRRLEAEAIRDTFLSISGTLNPSMGGRGFFPHLAGEVLAGASRPGLDWQQSTVAEQSRRSVYAYVRRSMLVPELDIFDYSNTTSPLGERPVTTVAPQALLLLNDPFIHRQASVFATRVQRETSSPLVDDLIIKAYQIALGRAPRSRELKVAHRFFDQQVRESSVIQSRFSFRPDVPSSLSVGYMDQLKPSDFLVGPLNGWTYHRGNWSASYEGISSVERFRGPFALWQGVDFTDGILEADLIMDRAAESASVLFKSHVKGTSQRGYEVCLEPRQHRITLLRQDDKLVTLAHVESSLPVLKNIKLRIECNDSRIRVWMGDNKIPIIDFVDSLPPFGVGKIGVRAWGAPVSFDSLTVRTLDQFYSVKIDDSESLTGTRSMSSSQRRGLESLCLLLLNLNEVIYVD